MTLPVSIRLLVFTVALLVMAVVGLLALVSLRRLTPDAGASVSGHRPEPPSEAP